MSRKCTQTGIKNRRPVKARSLPRKRRIKYLGDVSIVINNGKDEITPDSFNAVWNRLVWAMLIHGVQLESLR
jgi:hypothetical protein